VPRKAIGLVLWPVVFVLIVPCVLLRVLVAGYLVWLGSMFGLVLAVVTWTVRRTLPRTLRPGWSSWDSEACIELLVDGCASVVRPIDSAGARTIGLLWPSPS
jgi:hypothetical protein